MKSRVCIGNEEVAAPKFTIGDAVLHLTDTENSPESEWHDSLDPTPRFFWWYRGIVISVEYDYRFRRPNKESPWIYRIRVCEGFDSCTRTDMWNREPLLMLEADLKYSPYTARLFHRSMSATAINPRISACSRPNVVQTVGLISQSMFPAVV